LSVNVLDYGFEGLDAVESPNDHKSRQNGLKNELEEQAASVQIESVELAAVLDSDLVP